MKGQLRVEVNYSTGYRVVDNVEYVAVDSTGALWLEDEDDEVLAIFASGQWRSVVDVTGRDSAD